MLKNLVALVPWCEQTTTIAAALEICTVKKCDRLVAVNNRQQPTGIIYTSGLSFYLDNLSKVKKQNLLGSALKNNPNLIEPLELLPGDWSLEQFQKHLQQQDSSKREWAVVDDVGKYLGLVNSSQLLQDFVSSPPENSSVSQLALEFLIQVIDKLPWAVVLQTITGEVIAQSTTWQEHFGLWSDSVAVRQEIAELLVSPTPNKNSKIATEDTSNSEPAPSFSRCQLGTKPNTCVCICPTPDGQEKAWEFVKLPIANLSQELWLLVASDLSYQQQLASELAAKNAEIIQLNRLKDEFLACISHELKTPITAVMGLSTLLKDRALGQLNDRQERYARLIHQSGRHLMTVVNDILDLTRMETGQLKLTLEPVQIRSVCDRAVEQVKALSFKATSHQETSEEHQFTLQIESDIDIFIADELRLRQMLVNMLSNAYKFTEPGGEVGLQVNRWEGWIAFTVWDTGIGISEQQQHLIFQKFQQLENPLIRQFEGAGLGLVLTRALARLHGGDVTFLSKQGIGSSFTLLLPPSPPQKSIAEEETSPRTYPTPGKTPTSLLPTPPTAPTPLSLSGGRKLTPPSPLQLRSNPLILVVEAAPQFVENLSEQLNTLGYRVVVARSGTEALEKSRRLQPGSIFLNPVLPLLSGWDVLTLLKADIATNQIPVIITATGAEKEQAFLNGTDEFLSLPIQNHNLQQILNRFCSITPVFPPESNALARPRYDLLTVLWLVTPFESSLLTSSSLQLHHRVVEADDLEQAELLARIWQPNVVVIDGSIVEPLAYIQQLNKYPKLKKLPLVTLNAATTEAINQVPGLTVFPCLTTDEDVTINSLLAVLQVAAGISWQPSLLIVDIANLPDLQEKFEVVSSENAEPTTKNEWFQALVQYLQTAGFQTTMSQSWADVMPQIESLSVDVMLINLSNKPFTPQAIQALISLSKAEKLPPILVLDRLNRDNVKPQSARLRQQIPSYSDLSAPSSTTSVDVESILEAIATRILPPSLSMEELLNYIHEALIANE